MAHPFQLRTLGKLSLKGPGGRELDTLLARTKRVALLAYLALVGGFQRRDKLVAIFWPDLDQEHARSALRSALRVLREALGETPLHVRGQEEVGLAPTRWWCDAVAFEELLAEDRLEEALELYRGDFLDGFHLAECPEFERWQESERARLRSRAAEAARTLASEAEAAGDLIGATRWARRAVTFNPYDEGALRRLIETLDRSGDRVAAIHAYEAFARRIKEELDAEPAPETQAAIDAVRAREELATPTAPGRSVGAAQAEPRVAADGAAPGGLPRLRLAALAAATVVTLSVAVWAVVSWLGGGTTTAVVPAGEQASIAVLPFALLDGDGETEYFADGFTEELTNTLMQIDGLRVAGRTSSFFFKNKTVDVRDVGRQLGVAAVLEGGVQKSGRRVRVSARLTDARSGVPLWSQSYEAELEEIFAVQERISRAVVAALKITPPANGMQRLVEQPTRDLEAFELYLLGRYHWNQRTGQDLEQALRYFEEAIARDPSYAKAHSGLAAAYVVLHDYVRTPPADAFSLARAAALRALELDSALAEPHAVLGLTYQEELEWQEAGAQYLRAIMLDPNYPEAHYYYASYLLGTGDFEAALNEILRAQQLDPLSRALNVNVGRYLYFMRRYDAAKQQLLRSLRADPDFPFAHAALGRLYLHEGDYREAISELNRALVGYGSGVSWLLADLGYAYARAGDNTRARELLEELERRAAGEHVSDVGMALLHLGLGDRRQAMQSLDDAVRNRCPDAFRIAVDPLLDPLRDDPRFPDLLRRMGLGDRGSQASRTAPI